MSTNVIGQVRRLPLEDSRLLSGREYMVRWDGRTIHPYPFLAFDTETEVIDDLNVRIPRMALMTATNGHKTVVVHPDDLGRFILQHRDTFWVGFNTAFDYWVVRSELQRQGDYAALDEWDRLALCNRLCDAMLLDFLVDMARGLSVPSVRGLGQVARSVLSASVDKKDPFRKKFAELIESDWAKADPGFFEYAVRDVIVTWEVYHVLRRQAEEARVRVCPDQPSPYGPLTEGLQVWASVALDQIGRNGLHVDLGRVAEVSQRLRAELDDGLEVLEGWHPDLFHRYKEKKRAGQLKVNALTGLPQINQEVLRGVLLGVAERQGVEESSLPRTPKTGQVQTSLDLWRQIAPQDPFVATWSAVMDNAKLLQFLVKLTSPVVHADYKPLVRTGRTSCTEPNVQQMPREGWFRELFVPRPGHKLIIVDYAAIELRTLASVCYDKFGYSVLGDQIKGGRDPHCYTAALIGGHSYEEVLAGVKAEKAATKAAKEAGQPKPPTPFSDARQAAKALNFGVPGGLGAPKLAAYAKMNYGVSLTEEQAKAFRSHLITEVYPEIGEYLKWDFCKVLEVTLGTPASEVRMVLEERLGREGTSLLWVLEKVLAGQTIRTNGTSISAAWIAEAMDALASVCRYPDLRSALTYWEPGEQLKRRVLGEPAVTRTGRVRTACSYSEARNTPFQGLAADGAKLALWRLHVAGYRVVAFVHDEVVVESPADRAEEACKDVCRIMEEAMAEVVGHDIPIETEAKVSDNWSK